MYIYIYIYIFINRSSASPSPSPSASAQQQGPARAQEGINSRGNMIGIFYPISHDDKYLKQYSTHMFAEKQNQTNI